MANMIINVQGQDINVINEKDNDYICLTDMAKSYEGGSSLIEKWLSTKNTLEYITVWESLNNPDFNSPEIGGIMEGAGSNTFYMSAKKWIESTNSIGIKSKPGRYGGTYAHRDIALKFASYLSPAFELYIIKEFQRLKEIESNQYNLEWDVRRVMTKVNYMLHTDAVQKHIIPKSNRSKDKLWIEYAEEADLLNMAVYGYTAKQWKESNPQHALNGKNMRDFSSITDLLIMSNVETMSGQLMQTNLTKEQRFNYLKNMVDQQRVQFDKVDMVKSVKKSNPDTYITIENLTPEEIEQESKKDILQANRQALSDFNKKLKQGLEFNPKEDRKKKE